MLLVIRIFFIAVVIAVKPLIPVSIVRVLSFGPMSSRLKLARVEVVLVAGGYLVEMRVQIVSWSIFLVGVDIFKRGGHRVLVELSVFLVVKLVGVAGVKLNLVQMVAGVDFLAVVAVVVLIVVGQVVLQVARVLGLKGRVVLAEVVLWGVKRVSVVDVVGVRVAFFEFAAGVVSVPESVVII